MTERPALTREQASEASAPSGDNYELSGDFRGATINIKSTIVASAEVKDIEDLEPEPGDAPFQGLQYFDEQDADRFFGREGLTARIVTRLHRTRFLAVVGASGSGKSSVVRAGVIPALRRGERLVDGTLPPTDSGKWAIHTITPTAHPLEALAASLMRDAESVTAITTLQDELAQDPRTLALTARKLLAQRSDRHLLLMIDQFEEVFTACRNDDERQAFIDNLVLAVDGESRHPVTVLVTLRADYYAQCAQYHNLREVVSQHQEFIGAMSRDELFQAIVKPAALGDWKIQEGLIDLMLDEVGAEPGALPLLSHALLETWKRRRGRTMTLSGYTEAGGVRGAIAQTAETVFQQRLSPEQRPIARMVFVRLAELGEGAQDTRRRAAFSELLTRATDELVIEAVLSILADARLVTTDTLEPSGTKVVQVSHEALIREWPTLQGWLNENREALIRHRQLTEDVNDWVKLGRDPGALYRGERLRQTMAWREEYTESLSLLEQEFLDTSQVVARQEAEKAKKLARAQRVQRTFAAVSALLVLLVVLVVTDALGLFSIVDPPTMDGTFNIAVAEFGILGPDGEITNPTTKAGQSLSQSVFNDLVEEFQANPDLGIEVWHDSPELKKQHLTIGVLAEDAEGAETPEEAAKRLNADVVVYGEIEPAGTESFANLTLKFYVKPQFGVDLGDRVGIYQFKTDRPFYLPDPGLEVREGIAQQSKALAWITIGLTHEVLNESRQALDAFLKAEAFMEDSEIIQFFIGRERLFLAQKGDTTGATDYAESAKQAFERALDISDGRYARAHIGRGGTFLHQAQEMLVTTWDMTDTVAADPIYSQVITLTHEAIGAYSNVLEQADGSQAYGVPVEAIARLGIGLSYRVQGEALWSSGQDELAQDAFSEAVDTLTAAIPDFENSEEYRLLAQDYQGLGTAYEWQAYLSEPRESDDSEMLYRKAIDNYNECIRQGESFPIDTFLTDVVVDQYCVPYRDRLQEQIGSVEGE